MKINIPPWVHACQSATEHLTVDELSAKCPGDLFAKRVARYMSMLKGVGYIFDTRKRSLGDRVGVNEYLLVERR